LFSTGFQEVMLLKEQSRPRILRAGDSCVTVEFGTSISLEINGRVQQFRRLLEERALPGVRELVPTYRSLSVYFDPVEVDAGRFMATLESLAASTEERAEPGGKVMVVPVCYGGEFGPDIGNVAEHVVRLHTEPDYYCHMLGFTPGFSYLGGMNEKIATPRLQNPRTLIPAGSVGIAGSQTGIYPIDSPGGWQLIGRTPLVLFDPLREPPTLLDAGLWVRFQAVTEEEYHKIEEAVARRTWVPQILERNGE
jgi:KipI family sensor histidine kinase inhibitor